MSEIIIDNEVNKYPLRDVKTLHGVVDLTCSIVENISKRMVKLEGMEKKELAKKVMNKVIDRLVAEDKISETVASLARLAVDQDEVADIIDDVVDVWREHAHIIQEGCSLFGRFFKLCRK